MMKNWLPLLVLSLTLNACAANTPHPTQAHALEDRIWDVDAGQFISAQKAFQRAGASRYVLLGEKHDSAIHHAHQLRLLQALADQGRAPALALEQMDVKHQAPLSAAQSTGTQDAETLASAGQLNREGWRWPMYKALISHAAKHQWPLLAANLSRADARDIALGKVLPDLPALDATQRTNMENDVVRGHCGYRPDTPVLTRIVNAQRARDVQMAKVLDSVSGPVVLVAGAGHVRTDRAVPLYLAEPVRALAIAFVEVANGQINPEAYDGAGFDLLWFTAATPRPDACAKPLTGLVAPPAAPSNPNTSK
ncbi:ChaN family lipoprotein [Rhodoferax antarcticus]|nr:ChaN family lipoprotein [Rhodoferax antarcticus]